jgi:lipoprotein NlpD
VYINSWHKKSILILSLVACLTGCEEDTYVPPVEELHPQYYLNRVETTYTVRKGDTLQAIAFLYDLNPEQFASANQLVYPYQLKTGQVLKLTGHVSASGNTYSIPVIKTHDSPHSVMTSSPRSLSSGCWRWPTDGQVIANTGMPLEKKGITILGKPKQPIYASADGVVAYAGNGLPGYGHLILLKHPNNMLTAYAFNASLLVKEGQSVNAGQKIAEMGQLQSAQWGLHFEMRNRGQVINPKRYLCR